MTERVEASANPFPVRVRGRLDPGVSGWLWLVKWLLLVPHLLVLALLWVAFVVLAPVVLVAILFTGRYPRTIFEFTVGVLRWSWRVSYYGYGVLGTDRYPPFSLAPDAGYPADLEVDHPARLSRGLVLVKWWLLALPHYVVVGVLLGSGVWTVGTVEDPELVWGGGLVGILVLCAAVALAATGRYPVGIHDLLVGCARWALRVSAYAWLMTDRYPPFRLDQGPDEPEPPGGVRVTGAAIAPAVTGAPGTAAPQVGPPTPATPAPTPVPAPGTHARWGVGSLVVLVVGSLLVLGGLGTALGGGAILSGDARLRQDGYLPLTTSEAVYSPGHAVVVGDAGLDAGGVDGWWVARLLGDVRVEVAPLGDESLFVGVGAADDVDTYLSGVARTTPGLGDGRHDDVDGTAPDGPPHEQDVWAVSATGSGPQQLDWTPRPGSWSLVLMNADASPVVAADVTVLAKVPWVAEVGVAVVLTGLVVLLVGAVLVLLAVRAAGRHGPGT